ncbi:Ig-like domain-containing protein [Polaribacter cellanae]|uniref:GH18 domain-containing protein n=1 Tax=Polaribacter cellanae TaxID=2818493 RepID=A0A975H605_9FLAO|nr:Ig-like domain-containing protein [Polaribacter cellanae]QTE21961.1 hypothetical protein J3359_14235 [Polaribacter cellanae]
MKTLKFIGIIMLISFLAISCSSEDYTNESSTYLENSLKASKVLAKSKISPSSSTTTEPIVLGYFPSWSESWASSNQGSKLRDIPEHVTHVFLAFAKPNLTYTKGSLDITGTGIQTPYGGATLKESVAILKSKGIKVILSIGGETYWGTSNAYNINYQQIKDLVDDLGFEGIDWDFEPNGSFANIGTAENVQHFIDFFNNSRAIMPKGEYLLTCAPSGVGALGGLNNDDPNSTYAYSNRNQLTGETDTNLYNATTPNNGISLFGFGATGHMIPVIKAVGNKIDFIAYQGYNVGAATNRKIMYDSYRYYADQYGFDIVAGTHFPNEPWGPYYTFSYDKIADLSEHIKSKSTVDGIMIWQLLLKNSSSSSYGYLYVASQVLNGTSTSTAIANAENYPLSPYTGTGGSDSGSNNGTGCENAPEWDSKTEYNAGQQVKYNNILYEAKWWSKNDVPSKNTGSGKHWKIITNCNGSGNDGNTNIAPTTNITSPNSNSNFTENDNIIITASASDSDGTITLVEFYQGNVKIGQDTSAPYNLTWTNVSSGNYTLTVVATDNNGSSTTSLPIAINVTSPTNGGGNGGNTDCDNVSTWQAYPTIYNTGDVVKYQGVLYKAQTGPIWVTPGSGEHWWKTIGTCN